MPIKQPRSISSVHQAFAQRCAKLNLPVWMFDASGTAIGAAPSAEVALVVRTAAAATQFPTDPIPLDEHGHLLLLEECQGSVRVAITAVLVPASDVQRISTMLTWSFQDLLDNGRDHQMIAQFNDELAQSYEQNALLLSFSHALNDESDPEKLLHNVCAQLLDVLPFAWIGIRFQQSNTEVKNLAGKFVVAGTIPCPLDQFSRASLKLLQLAERASCPTLRPPGTSDLSTLVNAEVIAQPIHHDDRVIAILLAGNKRGPDLAVKSVEMRLLESTAGYLGIFHENIARFVEQEEQFYGTVRALTASIDAKDRYTHGHSERVSHLSTLMAQALKLSPAEIEDFRVAGLVHDVGKIGVPESILCKPSRPTDEEFARIRMHPQIGHDILSGIPKLVRSLPAVLHHHERWDGGGYPHGLAGEEIPLLARVMALADAFDAMSSTRSYRPALTRDKVLTEILHCAGGQFDPDLVPHFVRLDFSGFDQLVKKHHAAERFAA